MKPVLFVTGNVPAYRVGALAALHRREGIELALFGGRSIHGGAVFEGQMPFPVRSAAPAELALLARSPHHRAVVCPTGGRLAPLATWLGARAGRVPLILWASLWAHPRSAAHALTYVPLRRLYSHADAVVTYGPHVSRYVRARGAHNVHEAPQSIDVDFWGAAGVAGAQEPARAAPLRFLFVGRDVPEKGLAVLLRAWRLAALDRRAELLVVGPGEPGADPAGVARIGPVGADELRRLYEASDVLVVPSVRTRTFTEPWGLVCNEAMVRGLAVIASDAVGAAAGGLVRDGLTGLVVPAGDAQALAGAIERLAREPELRSRLSTAGRAEALGHTHQAWANGFSAALASLGLSARVGSFG